MNYEFDNERSLLQVPSGEVLTFGDDNFIKLEDAGVREAHKAAFVLVAGGLGERLGYKGIKVRVIFHSLGLVLYYIGLAMSLQHFSLDFVLLIEL